MSPRCSIAQDDSYTFFPSSRICNQDNGFGLLVRMRVENQCRPEVPEFF
jgi:hypothetical protein